MYQPVRNVADFHSLDEAEVLIGYMDGIAGLSLDHEVSRSYWHGWRNGLVDGGFIEADEAQLELDAAFSAPMEGTA